MQQRLLGQLRYVPICGVMEYQIRCLSFPTELLTSPTGLAALLYGRTSAAGSAGTEGSLVPPLTSPPGRWRRRHSPQKPNRNSSTTAAGSDGSGGACAHHDSAPSWWAVDYEADHYRYHHDASQRICCGGSIVSEAKNRILSGVSSGYLL